MTQPSLSRNTNGIIIGDGALGMVAKERVDFKSVGNTTLYAPEAGYLFIPRTLIFVATSYNAANKDASFNLGTNAASYDDFIDTSGLFSVAATGDYETSSIMGARIVPVANTESLVFRITGADSGTALVCDVQLWGWIFKS